MPDVVLLHDPTASAEPAGHLEEGRPAPLRVMTLHEPYATLIALGGKWIETRPNRTHVRGRIAIHAAARRDLDRLSGAWTLGRYEVHPPDPKDRPHPNHPNGRPARVYDNHAPGLGMAHWRAISYGAIIATADLYDCVPISPDFAGGHDHVQCPTLDHAFIAHRHSSAFKYDLTDVSDQVPYGWFGRGRT